MNLVVFDIDDTLTKSEDQHQLAFVNTMKEFGITNINKNWKDYKHHTDSYILKENYENNYTHPFELFSISSFENRMTEVLSSLKKVSEIKGAREFIQFVNNETEYAISYATGSLLKPAFVKLNQARINYCESLVVGSNKLYNREGIVKEAIERAKKHYGVRSFDHIISIGDGVWDLKTARNLGLHFVRIGAKNQEDFKKEKTGFHCVRDWSEFDLVQVERRFSIENTSTQIRSGENYSGV